MKKVAVITGSSRGLGLHLAEYFLAAGYTVIGIGRTNPIENTGFHFLKLDLGKTKKVNEKLNAFLKRKNISAKNEHVVLINNAATILPIDYIQNLRENDIQQAFQLNLAAPIMLSQAVIQKFFEKSSHVTICNISSGAATRPLVNWSIYCSMKSALKMFTDCINVDFADTKKLKSFSFYPGIMDTEMQNTIRKQSAKNFRNVEYFKELKKTKNLLDPKFVAKVVFGIIDKPNEIKRTEYDIDE